MEVITLTVDLELPGSYDANEFVDRLNCWASFCNDGVTIKKIVGKKNVECQE